MSTSTRENDSRLPTGQTSAPSEPLAAAGERGESGPEPTDSEAAALDKVRELLFGEQVRETGDRLRELEERFYEDTRRIHREITERMESLGRDLHAKLDQLAHQIVAMEDTARGNNEKTLERIGALRNELAEKMADSARVLDGKITENHENAIARAEQAAGALDEAKMGREALGALLAEMASRVSGE